MPCETPREDAHVGDEEPGLSGSDGFFPILCEPSTSSEPCERAFDDPSARQNLEALGVIGAFDDLHRPVADPVQGAAQFGSGVCAIGEQVAQPREAGDGWF